MRQASYVGERSMTVADVEDVPPGPGEIQVHVAYTGICGTDLHILHGAMDSRVGSPAVIGHEMSGTVVGWGPGVTGWAEGDPVTVLPVRSCGTCRACRVGHGHVCARLRFLGIDAPGSMQERWNVPADLVVPVPAVVPLDHAALLEPTAVAVHDVRRADLRLGERVLVVGGGPIGQLIALVARQAGAEVLVVEPDPYRRDVAAGLGFYTADPSADDALGEWRHDGPTEVAFEVSGTAAGISMAVDELDPRGRLVLVAIHPQPREVNLHRFFWRELTLHGARLYTRPDMEAAVRLMADGIIPAESLISRVEPLDRVGEAFAALESGTGVMKVLLDCGGR